MASLPYVTSPGNIDKALIGIKNASVPDRVSQDFVKTILKIPGGPGNEMTSFLKKLNLVNSDGSPSDLYRRFRNPDSSGYAISKAIKHAYAPLFKRNEFAHELSDPKLLGLILEETGQAHDSRSVQMAASCFKHLKSFADFGSAAETDKTPTAYKERTNSQDLNRTTDHSTKTSVGLNLGYTINLNLPISSDPAVFDAIFKSLKEHLLSQDDA